MTKCCDITAGDLRTLIYIHRLTRVSDGYGGATESWAADPTGGVWARVRTLTGTEAWENSRVIPGNLKKAVIRFRGDSAGAPYYTAADKVFIRGREYGILAVSDLEERQQWLELYLQEGRAS